MKRLNGFQIFVLLLLVAISSSCNKENTQAPVNDKIVLTSTPELFDLASGWADVFSTITPEVDVKVLSASESRIAESIENTLQLNLVSSEFEKEIYDHALWKMIVGRNIIVPVINKNNPHIEEICKQGISPAGLARLMKNPANTSWKTLFENTSEVNVSLYMQDDRELKEGICRFLNNDRFSFRNITNREFGDIADALQSDKYAIGICYLMDVLDKERTTMLEHVRILPIDKNGNGMIDYKEDVYDEMEAFIRAAWIGKYPRKLSNNIYAVASSTPSTKSELDFMTWVVTSGQNLLDTYGYVDLPEFESMANVRLIDSYSRPVPEAIVVPKEPGFFSGPLPYVLAAILLFTLIFFMLRQRERRTDGILGHETIIPGMIFNADRVEFENGFYYDKSHTWAFLEKEGSVKVGIDDFLQRVTGPITKVKMMSIGTAVKKGRPAVSIIQDGKQLDISAPVTGKIMEVNTKLTEDASLLNSSASSEGWIYRIEPTNWRSELQFMIMGSNYKNWLKTEFTRLKDFLADVMSKGNIEFATVLQDGGEIREHILKDLGPEGWEDFQTHFIDVS